MAKGLNQASLLRNIRISDLEPHEFEELREIATRFGDVTIAADRNTLSSLYEMARLAKKSASAARKRAASQLEKFVLSAAATRQLYYRKHQAGEERKRELGARLQSPEEPLRPRKKRKGGEETEIFG